MFQRRYCPRPVSVLLGILRLTYGRMGDGGRDVISIGKLVRRSDGPLEVEEVINTMRKYGVDGK